MKRTLLVIFIIAAVSGLFSLAQHRQFGITRTELPAEIDDLDEDETIPSSSPHTTSNLPTPSNQNLQDRPFNSREWGDASELDQLRSTRPTHTPTAIPSSTPSALIPEKMSQPPSNRATQVVDNPHVEALKELASNSKRILGSRGSKTALDSLADDGTTTEQTEDEDQDETVKKYVRVAGQARGYQMLYLMQPNARATVERQIETLIESEVAEPYLGVLTDGTFGKDFNYLNQVVRRLSANGRALTLALYLTNGSTQRTYKELAIDAGFNAIDPIRFRDLIQHDLRIRNQFSSMAKEARATFELNKSQNPNAKNIAIVMLEDNLDRASYASMRALAQRELAGIAQIIRNPCPGCTDGSDSDGMGDPIELHDPLQLTTLRSQDGFALDGIGYGFGPNLGANVLSVDQVKELLTLAKDRNLKYFGLWRAERQGRGQPGKMHPDQRTYEVPTPEQSKAEIELLRHGLALTG